MKRALVLTLTAIFIGLYSRPFLRNRQAETEETEAETRRKQPHSHPSRQSPAETVWTAPINFGCAFRGRNCGAESRWMIDWQGVISGRDASTFL